MTFQTVYSSKLTDTQIQRVFRNARYADIMSCSNCRSNRIHWLSKKKYRCKNCWQTRSLTTGTWIEQSNLPLRIWYELVWCFVLSHAAHKAGRLIGKRHETCWRVYQTIRHALTLESEQERDKITGTVELDESFYGGLFKNLRKETRWKYRREGIAKRGRGAKYRKQPVFGIYKRNGSVYLQLITEASKEELEEIIKRKIQTETEVFTDTFKSYQGLVGLGYIHSTVDHGMEIYVNGRIHVNGMEGFWGLSKTNMHTYKGIKKKNWIYYLKEMEFRYNSRKLTFEEQVLKVIRILMSYRKEHFVPI